MVDFDGKDGRSVYLLTTLPSTANRAVALSVTLSSFGNGRGGAESEVSDPSERVMKGNTRELSASRLVDIVALDFDVEKFPSRHTRDPKMLGSDSSVFNVFLMV